jgi:hypothetical protein
MRRSRQRKASRGRRSFFSARPGALTFQEFRKVEGEDIASIAIVEQPEHKIIDIMEALKASL